MKYFDLLYTYDIAYDINDAQDTDKENHILQFILPRDILEQYVFELVNKIHIMHSLNMRRVTMMKPHAV